MFPFAFLLAVVFRPSGDEVVGTIRFVEAKSLCSPDDAIASAEDDRPTVAMLKAKVIFGIAFCKSRHGFQGNGVNQFVMVLVSDQLFRNI